jgi:hypothetical protein
MQYVEYRSSPRGSPGFETGWAATGAQANELATITGISQSLIKATISVRL